MKLITEHQRSAQNPADACNDEADACEPRRDRWKTLILLVLLVTFHTVIQLPATVPVVFPQQGGIRLLGNDAYFHLRHADHVARDFPRLLREDPYAHFSQCVRSDACSLFDVGIAAGSLLLSGGVYSASHVILFAALTPLLLGAASVVAIFALTRLFAGARLSLLTAAMFVCYPGPALGRMLLGAADHHVAEILLALLTFAGLYVCLKSEQSKRPPRWYQPAFGAAAPLIVFLFTWVGAPLYLGVAGLTIAILLLFTIRLGQPGTPIVVAAFRYGTAVLGVCLPLAFCWPDGIIHQSAFRCGMLAAAVIALAPFLLNQLAWLVRQAGLSPKRTVQLVVATIAVTIVIAIDTVPEVRMALAALQKKSLVVSEQLQAATIARWYLQAFGLPGLLSVAAVVLVAQRIWSSQTADYALFGLAAATTLMWLIARWVGDYDYVVAAIIPVLAGITLHELHPLIARLGHQRMLKCGFVALLVVPIWPAGLCTSPFSSIDNVVEYRLFHDGWQQAMQWLRNRTPGSRDRSRGPTDNAIASDYGVACAWEFGNIISMIGKRTPVWSRYPNKELSQWMLAPTADAADALLREICNTADNIKYVVLDERSITTHFPGHISIAEENPWNYFPQLDETSGEPVIRPAPAFKQSVGCRLYHEDGRDLSCYRLVYESPDLSAHAFVSGGRGVTLASFRGAGFVHDIGRLPSDRAVRTVFGLVQNLGVRSSVKIFERVRGAVISGNGPPGAHVTVSLSLRARTTRREFAYSSSSKVTEEGRFQIVVPYSTEVTPGAEVAATGEYRLTTEMAQLESDGETQTEADNTTPEQGTVMLPQVSFVVSEAAVRNGKTIEVHLPAEATRPSVTTEIMPQERV